MSQSNTPQQEQKNEIQINENDIENQGLTLEPYEMENNGEKFYLTWEDIDLHIEIDKSKKMFTKKLVDLHILKGISGYAESGECLAIMGGSGAGKSTLLNIISGRFLAEGNMKLSGKVELNGHEMNWRTYRNVIGFVMQKDIFMESLQVDEIFKFVIELININENEEEKQKILKQIIRQLKLERAQNNQVGGEIQKGISGGEKRRLNIGFELLKKPKILFLDEPTSGLDSYTSYIIVKLLRELARTRNMIIVYTIHQPSVDMGELFDRLMILNKGKVAFFDTRDKLEEYYKNLGEPCPEDVNPLDHAIDVALTKGTDVDEKFFNQHMKSERGYNYVKQKIDNKPTDKIDSKVEKASFIKQFATLSKRSFTNFVRTPMTFKIRIAQITFIAIFMILLFWRMDKPRKDDTLSINNRLGALFFVTINMFITYLQTSIAMFPVERQIFVKEYDSGLYSIVPYYFSKLSIELPLTGMFPALFVCVIYYIVNFNNNAGSFFLFIVGVVLSSWLATLIGIFVGTLVHNPNTAIEITPMIFVPIMLFSGYTTNTNNIVAGLKWLEYMSPIRYLFEYFVHNEFDSRDDLGNVNPVETLNFELNRWKIILILVGYILFLFIASLITLKLFSRQGLKN